jgi:putative transcriptional regulator
MERLAGYIALHSNPSAVLRQLRQRLSLSLSDMARLMHISPSMVCDYERGRRQPGLSYVRRYIEAISTRLAELERQEGLGALEFSERLNEAIIAIGDYRNSITVQRALEALGARPLTRYEPGARLYGYTVLDSLKAIRALSGFEFLYIFGSNSERALIFTKVGLGRSPMVAVRISPLKPRLVVIHGAVKVDPLAIELAERDGVALALAERQEVKELVAGLQRAFAEGL